jgi:hypothetical protein
MPMRIGRLRALLVTALVTAGMAAGLFTWTAAAQEEDVEVDTVDSACLDRCQTSEMSCYETCETSDDPAVCESDCEERGLACAEACN